MHLSLLSVLASTCQGTWHLSVSPISPCHLCQGARGWWSAFVTENGSLTEGCVIRLHCVALCSLTEYGFSFSCGDGAITKSLKAMGAFWDKLSGAWASFWMLHSHYTSSVYNARGVSEAIIYWITAVLSVSVQPQSNLLYTTEASMPLRLFSAVSSVQVKWSNLNLVQSWPFHAHDSPHLLLHQQM